MNPNNQAFELARVHGMDAALQMTRQWRDASSPGTVTFALHNAVYRALLEAKSSGAMFRTIGESK